MKLQECTNHFVREDNGSVFVAGFPINFEILLISVCLQFQEMHTLQKQTVFLILYTSLYLVYILSPSGQGSYCRGKIQNWAITNKRKI